MNTRRRFDRYVGYLGEAFYTGHIDEETKQRHNLRVNRLEVERLATIEQADKREVDILQIESENEAAALHELLRPCIAFESDIEAMKYGRVIFSAVPAPLGDGKLRMQTRTSWLSGTNHVISISAIKT